MNSIGDFSFLSLEGQPIRIGEEVILLARPGVDGVAIWKTGLRGRKFTLRSAVDGFNEAYAYWLYTQYTSLIGADPTDLRWNGIWITDAVTLVKVLDVKPVRIQALAGGVGGQAPPSEGWCECDWDLILVDVTPAA